MSNKPRLLYTVYRNADDRLMILDGSIHDCMRVLGIRKNTFYAYKCRQDRSPYTIIKSTQKEVERDMQE